MEAVLDHISGLMPAGRATLALRLIDHAMARIEKAVGEIDDSDGHCTFLLNRARDKRDCLTPGCGAVPFNKIIEGFRPDDTLLAGAVPLYDRASGATWRAADLPVAGDSSASA